MSKLSPQTRYRLRLAVGVLIAVQMGRQIGDQVRSLWPLAKWIAAPLDELRPKLLIDGPRFDGELHWHYGPTAGDSDPGSMWCYDCRARVYALEGGYVCSGCGRTEVIDETPTSERANSDD